MSLKSIILFLLAGNISIALCAQIVSLDRVNEKPIVGSPIPDFKLDRVHNFSVKDVTAQTFKGKWLFLDFWFQGCTTCIKSMPKISELKKEFGDQAVFLMVGNNDRHFNGGIAEMYDRLKKKYDLKMEYVFDSLLVKKWEIHSMPHIVIVNPNGIVEAITDGRDMTRDKVAALLRGEHVSFFVKDAIQAEFDPLGGARQNVDNVVYQSILTSWNGERQEGMDVSSFVNSVKNGGKNEYRAIMMPLYRLYNLAYYGKMFWLMGDTLMYKTVYPVPVLELKDTSLFEYDYKFQMGKGTYNYSLSMPVARISERSVMVALQGDLMNSFGYSVSIEYRDVPVWELVIANKKSISLKTKGGETRATVNPKGGMRFVNYSISGLINMLTYYITNDQLPFVDGTGIRDRIDINMSEDLTTFETVKKGLQKSGLDFVKGTRKMNVMVIRDPHN